MTQTSFPFDAGPGANITEDQWRKMAMFWLETGVIVGELLELLVFADSTGMQVKVNTGKAWIRGHYYESDATVTLAIAAAHATLARIDRVVVRIDFTANTGVLAVVTGTAGAGVPALTQSTAIWEIGLAQVSIPALNASVAAGQVTDERTYAQNTPRAHVTNLVLDNHAQYLLGTGTRTVGGAVLVANAIGVTPLIARGAVGQTAPPFIVQNSALATLLSVSAASVLSTVQVVATATSHNFGTGAAGGAGTYTQIGDLADASNTTVSAQGSGANAGLILRAKGSGQLFLRGGAGLTAFQISDDGTNRYIGFFGTAPGAKPAPTGSRGANAALASLLTALAGLGLITDSTTA